MATRQQIHPHALHTAQFSFIDTHGRRIHLRGVNLANKNPLDQPSHLLRNFWETAETGGESFIGEPLNLEDGSADEHLARLRGWGFNLLRFPVTWEALEHAGPKKYDYEYMDYLVRVLCKCKQYGFRVYMDPHQDIWSRFSGGSGAPFWTLPACGINPYNLSSTQAALIQSEWPLPHDSDPASFPAMIWSTNYGRLLSLTLFTLFFAGRAFAPNCIIDDVNIQDYLQSHYISAFGELADRIRRADEEEGLDLRDACIIGWDSLNEPAEGLIEWDDLNNNPTRQGTTLKKGTRPTPAQSLRLGMGQPQTVETWDFGMFGPKRTGTATIDPKGRKIWAEPDITGTNGGELPDGTHPRWGWKRNVGKWPLGTCIWALHGVWDVQSGYILRPDYFKYHPSTGIEVHFLPDFWLPHFTTYTSRIRSVHPHSISFVQPPVFALPPHIGEEVLNGRCAYTGHYYDGLTLITKHWNWFNADSLGVLRGKYSNPIQAVKFGEKAIRKSLMEQIGLLIEDAKLITAPPLISSSTPPPSRNEYPTVIGEIGIPFDMDSKRSYYSPNQKYKGNYSNQEKALDASLNACDGYNNVNYTVWTYLARGHNHEWGDTWNGEDLSLWSPDDMRDCEGHSVETKGVGSGSLLRRRRSTTDSNLRRVPQKTLKSESQAGLLANQSSPHLLSSGPGSKNFSTLTLNTLSSTRMPGGGESPVLSTPSASTPTLLGGLMKKKSTGGFSVDSSATPSPLVPPKLPKGMDGTTATEATSVAVASAPLSGPTVTTAIITTATTANGTAHADKIDKCPSTSSTLVNNVDERDPYDFLTNGARAIRAFCRPRPVKVYGKVVDTAFDIKKAEFKCVIRPQGLDMGTGEVPEEEEGRDEENATEIYLPLVHFASREVLEGSRARWDPERGGGEKMRVERMGMEMMGGSRKVYGESLVHARSSPDAVGEKRFLESVEHQTDLLDVEVKVSHGTEYKIRGQSLYWWYPHSSSYAEGEGEGEVVIEVRRRGGAIEVRNGGWVEVPPQVRGKKGEKSLCEKLCECDFGCVVM